MRRTVGRPDQRSEVRQWLKAPKSADGTYIGNFYVSDKTAEITHTVMSGGAYNIPIDHEPRFIELLARDVNNGVTIPSFSAIHTSIFPMFYDFDAKLPVPELSTDAVDEIARVMDRQTRRFFLNNGPFTIVVCGKSKGAEPMAVSGTRWEQVPADELSAVRRTMHRLDAPPEFVAALEQPDPLRWTAVDDDRGTSSLNPDGACDQYRDALEALSLRMADFSGGVVTLTEAEWNAYRIPASALTAHSIVQAAGGGARYAPAMRLRETLEVSDVVVLGLKNRHGVTFLSDDFVELSCGAVVRPAASERRWKHGMHVHFRSLHVNIERATMIRAFVVEGLSGNHDWESLIGVATPDWDAYLDIQVYHDSNRGGGLRMIHAPKMVACPIRHTVEEKRRWKKSEEVPCVCFHADGRILDDNVYLVSRVFEGGEANDRMLAQVRANAAQRFKWTSVRCPDTTTLTPGWTEFDGAPRASAVIGAAASGREAAPSKAGGKRRVRTEDEKACGTGFAQIDVPVRVLNILRDEVVKHGRTDPQGGVGYYDDVSVRLVSNAQRTVFCVNLYGNGARYCLNKQREHRSRKAYMRIVKQGDRFLSRMKCFCRKPELGSFKMTCQKFASAERLVSRELARELTALRADTSSSASSSSSSFPNMVLVPTPPPASLTSAAAPPPSTSLFAPTPFVVETLNNLWSASNTTQN